jgi:hypothetical protein
MKYSYLRYKKQEKFAPYIPIAKARGFTALSGKIKAPQLLNAGTGLVVWLKRCTCKHRYCRGGL